MSDSLHAIKHKLSNITLSHVLPRGVPLTIVTPTHTISQVFDLLNKNKIRSVPVVQLVDNEKQTDKDSTNTSARIQMVDFADILYYFVDCVIRQNADLGEFLEQKVADVTNYSGRNPPPITLSLSDKLGKASSYLRKGMRRVFVENDSKELVGIITHTDMMRIAEENLHDTELGRKTVGELGVTHKITASIDESASVVEAFEKIRDNKLEYLPIVSSHDGTIISVISVRDIKLVFVEGKDVLNLSVMDFISRCRQMFSGARETFPIFFCKKDYPMLNTIQRLLKTHVHRLIVTDDKQQPLGEVTVRSLLEHIFLEDE